MCTLTQNYQKITKHVVFSFHKPGQAIKLMHLPLRNICSSGQKHPAAHPAGGTVTLVSPHI